MNSKPLMERCGTCPAIEGDRQLCNSIINEGFCDLYSFERPTPSQIDNYSPEKLTRQNDSLAGRSNSYKIKPTTVVKVKIEYL